MVIFQYSPGQKFFKLTLMNKTKNKRGNKILWDALCDCGNVAQVIPYSIRCGNTKTCGQCDRPKQFKNWSGTKFHNLIFIKPHKNNKNQQMIWEAQCICGKIIYTIPSNKAKSCGCISNAESAKRCALLGKSSRKFHPKISSARHLWRPYKDGDINFELFYKLSQQPCHYCGKPPSNKYNHKDNKGRIHADGLFIYNGLDRIDSSIGHFESNVVSCCYDCNQSKMDKSVNEFLLHIKRVYENNIEKIQALNFE